MRIALQLSYLSVGLILAGCASTNEKTDIAMAFIEEMDCLPADEQVPNWQHTRSLMLREAPRVGDVAPDFELPTREGNATIRLTEFQPTKPVVLIFGSWT